MLTNYEFFFWSSDSCGKKLVDLCMIPGGMTKHLQPLDIAVNRSFKSKVKGEYWKRKREEWREREGWKVVVVVVL